MPRARKDGGGDELALKAVAAAALVCGARGCKLADVEAAVRDYFARGDKLRRTLEGLGSAVGDSGDG